MKKNALTTEDSGKYSVENIVPTVSYSSVYAYGGIFKLLCMTLPVSIKSHKNDSHQKEGQRFCIIFVINIKTMIEQILRWVIKGHIFQLISSFGLQ